MKSTGLFGKNSGRVGGVVYSNYRGQQIVRSYQPQVKNPNSKAQVAQRAKFKLVSQVGASLGREIANSYVSEDANLTARNSWVRRMLKNTRFAGSKASLPIEEIVLTNARGGLLDGMVQGSRISVAFSPSFATLDNSADVKARAVFIAYNEGGEISILTTEQLDVSANENGVSASAPVPAFPANFGNVRALVYGYRPNIDADVSYADYDMLGDDATLDEIVRVLGSRNIDFTETFNVAVPQNV